MRLHAEQRDKIWADEIIPEEFEFSMPSPHPMTIMVGAQPGAGKSEAIQRLRLLYPDENLTYINPDELRTYHPDAKRLMKENPTVMPKRTAHASADWTAKSIRYANDHQYSIELEGTWRNPEKALDIMRQAKAAGRTVHAVALAVPRRSRGSPSCSGTTGGAPKENPPDGCRRSIMTSLPNRSPHPSRKSQNRTCPTSS